MKELLIDIENLIALREAKKAEQDAPTQTLDAVMQKYGLSPEGIAIVEGKNE